MTRHLSKAQSPSTATSSRTHHTLLTLEEKRNVESRTQHATLALLTIFEDRVGPPQCRKAPRKYAFAWLAEKLLEADKTECSEQMYQLFEDAINGHRILTDHYESTGPVERYVEILGHDYLYEQ